MQQNKLIFEQIESKFRRKFDLVNIHISVSYNLFICLFIIFRFIRNKITTKTCDKKSECEFSEIFIWYRMISEWQLINFQVLCDLNWQQKRMISRRQKRSLQVQAMRTHWWWHSGMLMILVSSFILLAPLSASNISADVASSKTELSQLMTIDAYNYDTIEKGANEKGFFSFHC